MSIVKQTSIKWISFFRDNPKGNKFENLPAEVEKFFNQEGSENIITAMLDNLESQYDYEIEISFKRKGKRKK